MTPSPVVLSSGAELRLTGPPNSAAAVVCVNGGGRGEVEGTWSASLEWLVQQLASSFPQLAFAEVRYRIKSWQKLDWCIEDARSAIEATGAARTLLVGFSMGGAVASQVAAETSVEAVVGLAPWFPDRLPLDALSGRRLRVLHGSLDGRLPGLPGVSPASSRRGFDRARALGVEAEYTIIPGAVHGLALRAHWGHPVPLPRARTWARLVGGELTRFAA
ncbi:MAG: dienelactone hydrolase family protein [Gaiellaceae bacterium]